MPRSEAALRFLLDGMLGKLTRWLRIVGYDAEYAGNSSDRELILRAKNEGRILLTSDIELCKSANARGISAYLVKGKNETERLSRLARRFRLRLHVLEFDSRCPTCGHSLTLAEKSEIASQVPAGTLEIFDEFWRCGNSACRKVYWRGSHWNNINRVLESAAKLATKGEERRRG